MKTVEYNEQDLQEMASVISKLSLADTFKLMKILEKDFGIRVVNGVLEKEIYCGVVGDGYTPPMEDERLYKVFIINVGPYKLQVVKTIKDLTGLGLKESKDVADAASFAPSLVKECEGFEAELIKSKLTEAGALVSIK